VHHRTGIGIAGGDGVYAACGKKKKTGYRRQNIEEKVGIMKKWSRSKTRG